MKVPHFNLHPLYLTIRTMCTKHPQRFTASIFKTMGETCLAPAPWSQLIQWASSKVLALAHQVVAGSALKQDPSTDRLDTCLVHAPAASVIEGVVAKLAVELSFGHVQDQPRG